jgi:hypothetical protein
LERILQAAVFAGDPPCKVRPGHNLPVMRLSLGQVVWNIPKCLENEFFEALYY